MLSRRLFLGAVAAGALRGDGPRVGPARGTLVVIGGGAVGKAILERMVEAAGGRDAPLVYVPTAGDADSYAPDHRGPAFLHEAFPRMTVLHTRDRQVADTEAFAAPLAEARAVFFGGGRQWRLVDSYMGTRTQRAFEAVLQRGGVIGGTSAGATIQGSYLVRGAREGNHIMMAPGYERGFGYLRGVAVDQHLLRRKRENDLVAVIDAHPELLGIGIDEATAIVVRGDAFEVVGESKVAIYDAAYRAAPGQPRYYFLAAGDRFDLGGRVANARR